MKKIAVFISAVVIGASLCALVNAQTTDTTTPQTAVPIQEKTAPAAQSTQQKSEIPSSDEQTQQPAANSNITPV